MNDIKHLGSPEFISLLLFQWNIYVICTLCIYDVFYSNDFKVFLISHQVA